MVFDEIQKKNIKSKEKKIQCVLFECIGDVEVADFSCEFVRKKEIVI